MSGNRRKSLSIFRPTVSSLTPIRDSAETSHKEPTNLKKILRPTALFSSSPTNQPSSPLNSNGHSDSASPHVRPRTLQKTTRPSSIFGSLRSLHSLPDEDENLIQSDLMFADGNEEMGSTVDLDQMSLLHHGEVQMAGSMFRKRSQYLVLTTTHLLRFKNQSKASEMFPEIPSSHGEGNSVRHARMSSAGSNPEAYLLADPHAAISLHNVVAAYKLDDGRPYFSIELAHYDEATHSASTMNMQLNDPRDYELWLTSIRAALIKCRLADHMPFGRRALEYAARTLEVDSDYDPQHFRMFTVVQRATKSGGRSSSDDLGKLLSNVYYLVIGIHKVHLLPLPKMTKSASSTSLSDLSGTSYGLMCLSSVHVHELDDAFQLGFRSPLQPQQNLYLSSASANDIALCVRQAAEWLRPNWVEEPFIWKVPNSLNEALLPVPEAEEEYQCFDRTLVAYCVSYKVDPSNVRYTVNFTCEDAPEFQLLDPANSRKAQYTLSELLAILRSLRYNESFRSVSFKGVKLDALHSAYDRHGSEHFMWSTKSGGTIKLPRLDGTPLIVQEFQCLALKSTRLRRVDFTDAMSQKSREISRSRDPGSGLCEALFPLCLLNYTNVDWVVLNGVALSEQDLEYIYAAAIKRVSHLRAVELARCGLDTDMLRICLEGLSHQTDTLEVMVISGNPGMLNSDILVKNMAELRHVRRVDLSKVQFESTPDPIIGVDLLLRWKLESLVLSGTTLNAQTVDAISAYLVTPQSNTLREIRMEQCQLNGEDVATILRSMQTGRSGPRELHLAISENRLERNHSRLVAAIRDSVTPTHLTMQTIEYSQDRNFIDLLRAVSTSTSLTYLDISRISVPYDASIPTCEELQRMFETNTHLTHLNISGEQAHLEAVTLGRGLPSALAGLEDNKTLQVLHIEHQALGLPGASALATVLLRNSTLREIHCDNNEISLQAFTTLVNAAKDNPTLLYLPSMEHDRAWSRAKIDREVSGLMRGVSSGSNSSAQSATSRASAALKKARGTTSSMRSLSHRSDKSAGSDKDSSSSSPHPPPSSSSAYDPPPPQPPSTSGSLGPGPFKSRPDTFSTVRGDHHYPAHGTNKQLPIPGYTAQDVAAAVSSLDQRWDAEIGRLQGYLERNFALVQGSSSFLLNPNAPLPSVAEGIGTSPTVSRPNTAPGVGGVSGMALMGALARAAQERTPTAELDRQLGGSGPPAGGPKRKELEQLVGPELTLDELYVGEKDGAGEGGLLGEEGVRYGIGRMDLGTESESPPTESEESGREGEGESPPLEVGMKGRK